MSTDSKIDLDINGEMTRSNLFYVKFENDFINPKWVVSTTLPKPGVKTLEMVFHNIQDRETKETVFEKFVNWQNQKNTDEKAEIILLDGNGDGYTTFEIYGLRPFGAHIINDLDYISTEYLRVKVGFTYINYVTKFKDE